MLNASLLAYKLHFYNFCDNYVRIETTIKLTEQ